MASRLSVKSIEQYALSVIAEPGRSGLSASLVRGFLGGCAGLYDFGLETYLAGESLRLRKRGRLPIPVISIGNLTVGGTGKTPMTQLLCRRLGAQGKRVGILSRGHRGEGYSVRLVSDNTGKVLLTAAEAGDEPVLLAQTLPGSPVLVGKDRRQSGREALRRFALDALLLDDGFQYWQLARDLDIVLLDARRPFDNGYPLPRGLLREPKRHLRRAGIVVATRAGGLSAVERQALTDQITALAPHAALYFAEHRAAGLCAAGSLSEGLLPNEALAGKRIFAVSAIAQPQSFLQSLAEDVRADVVGQRVWDDHHHFTQADCRQTFQAAEQAGAEAVVMTEKDSVKWPASKYPESLPAYSLRVEMVVEDEEGLVRTLIGLLQA